jgi:hypothetical protein
MTLKCMSYSTSVLKMILKCMSYSTSVLNSLLILTFVLILNASYFQCPICACQYEIYKKNFNSKSFLCWLRENYLVL